MAQWRYLQTLSLQCGEDTVTFLAEEGHLIEVTFEPLDIVFETASRKQLKIKKGWRAKVQIEFIVKVSNQDDIIRADFLRRAANVEEVLILRSTPLDFGGKHLAITSISHPDVWSNYVFVFKVEGFIVEALDNIPALE